MANMKMHAPFCLLQKQKDGMQHALEFQKAIKEVLANLRAKGPLSADDYSIGALLLKAMDPKTGSASAECISFVHWIWSDALLHLALYELLASAESKAFVKWFWSDALLHLALYELLASAECKAAI